MSTSILNVRVNETERSLLETAAKQAHTTLREFVRRKAVEPVELEVLEQHIIEIPIPMWEQFETWLNAPTKEISSLQHLATNTPVWEK